MKKWLINITGILTISSSALPLTGCTFNFYVNNVKAKVAKNLAIQSSNVIKSLIASKHLNSDTQTTINDAFSGAGDTIIKNQTNSATINDWGEFRNNWGFNQEIKIKGFDQDSFIVPNGQGSLTKQINSLKNTNSTLQYLNYINTLNVIDNQTLHGVVLGKNAIAKPIISDFLKSLKNKTLPEPYLSLVENLILNYQTNFLTPITDLLNELTNGWNDVSDPKNNLKPYMEAYKDADGQTYSEWTENGQWELASTYFEDWKPNDLNLYHGGVLINYLFKKIGIDNPDKIPNPQYLGAIITDNINAEKPDEAILAALQPYLDLLLTNPKYLLLLINGVIPLIKQVIFNADDLTQGIKNLTLGNHYPTDKTTNSYNLKEVLTDLKNLLTDKDKTAKTIENILTSPLLFDVKIKYSFFTLPLGLALKLPIEPVPTIKKQLIETITGFLTGDQFTNIFNDVYNIVRTLNDQFQNSDGINLSLDNLKNLLLNEKNGLLVLLKEVATTIANIIRPTEFYADDDQDEITDQDLEKLYQSIGGQLAKDGIIPIGFKENSILWVLKNESSNSSSDLSNVIKIITRDDQYQGVANIIVKQNEDWIKTNYTNYLLPNYVKSKITNIKYERTENSTEQIIKLSYDFFYEIKGVEYNFLIKGIIINNKDSFLGTHNFKFTDINRL